MTHRKVLRTRTGDRAPPPNNEILTVEQIGPKRAKTPNGNLICYAVPIARTGLLMYRAGELPLKSGPDGVIRVTRDAAELFRDETIASFEGCAVTEEHPEGGTVTPRNWKMLAHGFAMNVRRGQGDDSDVLFADLVITDKYLIERITEGKVEVSAGYEADYDQIEDGEAVQVNILGNHIALVDRGRCGPRCAIGDHDPSTKGNTMPIRKRLMPDTAQRLRALIGDASALLEESADPNMSDDPGGSEAGESHIHIHVNGQSGGGGDPDLQAGAMPKTTTTDDPDADPNAPAGGDLESRVAALETGMKQLIGTVGEIAAMMKGGGEGGDPTKDGDDPDAEFPDADPGAQPTRDSDDPDEEFPDEVKTKDSDDPAAAAKAAAVKTGDSAALANSYQQLVADCEILVPGMRIPTFDSKVTRVKTVDRMCGIRRRALHQYAATADGAAILGSNADPAKLDDMPCGALATCFKTAVAAQRVINNRIVTGDSGKAPKQDEQPAGPLTLADLNAQFNQFWQQQPTAH